MLQNDRRMSVAQNTGIDKCVCYNPRQGGPTRRASSLAVNAILGSVFKDSKDTTAVWRVMLRIGLIPESLLDKVHTITNVEIGYDIGVNEELLFMDSRSGDNTVTDSRTAANVLNPLIDDDLLPGSPSTEIISDMHKVFLGNMTDTERTQGSFADSVQPPEVSSTLVGSPDYDLGSFGRFHDEIILHGAWTDPIVQGQSPTDVTYSCTGVFPVSSKSTLPNVDATHHDNIVDGSMIRSDSDASEAILSSSHKKRKANIDYVEGSKMKRVSNNRLTHEAAKLEPYIFSEEEKCKRSGCPLPRDTFFVSDIQSGLSAMGAKAIDVGKILIGIASSESIATIRDLLHMYRNQPNPQLWYPYREISKEERFYIIEDLDLNITGFNLFRRYHTLELYEQCGGPDTGSSDSIIVTTKSHFDGRKSSGNPRHLAERQIAEAMMAEIFPNIKRDHKEYSANLRKVKRTRKLGKRFHILKERFGRGILALMPDDGLGESLNMGMSDKM